MDKKDFMLKLDDKVLRALYSLNLHPKLNKMLRGFTRMGDGYAWLFFVVFVLFFYELSEIALAFRRTAFVMIICVPLYKIVKKKTCRPRPYLIYDNVVAQIPPLDEHSFPSGHTMNNLAAALSVSTIFPETAGVIITVPILWGVLRVHFGVHYLSDVLGGVALAFLSFLAGYAIDSWFAGLF